MNVKVKINWVYKDLFGECFYDYGYPEFKGTPDDIEGLMFNFEEGNYSCDCNRCTIVELPDMHCGQEIKFINIIPLLDTIK